VLAILVCNGQGHLHGQVIFGLLAHSYILPNPLALLSGLWLLVMRTRVFCWQLDAWFLLYHDLFSKTKRTEQTYFHILKAPD
jgi:hypothetical protein